MKDKIIKIYKKYDSFISYAFFGVLTTIINVLVYYILSKFTSFGTVVNTIIAWIAAVLFAFVTNRKWVFKSENTKKAEILNEAVKFFLCRLLTGILDVVIMYVFVDLLKCNDLLIKIISNIIVIIVNFVASKYIIFVKNKNGNLKDTYINACIYLLFFVLACIFLMNSPLNPIKYGEAGTDSAVFKHIGYLMTKGYVPYRDLFDHKGPLIYFYNYIGTFITYYRGVWIIEVISLFIAFAALYKSSRLYINRFYSIIVVLICASILGITLEEGNLVEEYALPFISIGLYTFLEYFKKKDITKLKLILNGLCFGTICMLRPNMVSLWMAFCLLILVQKIKEKRLIDVLYFILYFLIGAAIIIVPFCIWLIKVNAWHAFIDDYIKFNLMYSNFSTPSGKFISFVHFTFEPVTIIAILYSMYMIYKYKEDRLFNIFNLLYISITLYMIIMAGRLYDHYAMVMTPCVLYTYATLFKNLVNKKNNDALKIVVVGYLIISLIIPVWSKTLIKVGNLFDKTTSNNISSMTAKVVNYIKKNSDENDKISVYGNYSIIYVLTKRDPASIYTYTTPIKSVDDSVLPKYYKDLDKNKPKFIVIREYSQSQDILEYIKKNKYELVLEVKGEGNRKANLYELKENKQKENKHFTNK